MAQCAFISHASYLMLHISCFISHASYLPSPITPLPLPLHSFKHPSPLNPYSMHPSACLLHCLLDLTSCSDRTFLDTSIRLSQAQTDRGNRHDRQGHDTAVRSSRHDPNSPPPIPKRPPRRRPVFLGRLGRKMVSGPAVLPLVNVGVARSRHRPCRCSGAFLPRGGTVQWFRAASRPTGLARDTIDHDAVPRRNNGGKPKSKGNDVAIVQRPACFDGEKTTVGGSRNSPLDDLASGPGSAVSGPAVAAPST